MPAAAAPRVMNNINVRHPATATGDGGVEEIQLGQASRTPPDSSLGNSTFAILSFLIFFSCHQFSYFTTVSQ